jgi:hypothetical protein
MLSGIPLEGGLSRIAWSLPRTLLAGSDSPDPIGPYTRPVTLLAAAR